LVLTSNYGSKDFQFLKIGNKKLYEIVIDKAKEWNEQKIGFVIGANHFRELKNITFTCQNTPILVPGIGSQKNSLEKTINSLKHNLFIINQSRSIIYSAQKAQNPEEFKDIIRLNALKARNEINYLITSGS
jgi:orotidine-5'-phosphate decarboxylase